MTRAVRSPLLRASSICRRTREGLLATFRYRSASANGMSLWMYRQFSIALHPPAWSPRLISLSAVEPPHPAVPTLKQNDPNPAQAGSLMGTLTTERANARRLPISVWRHWSHCSFVITVLDVTPSVLPSQTVQTFAPSRYALSSYLSLDSTSRMN